MRGASFLVANPLARKSDAHQPQSTSPNEQPASFDPDRSQIENEEPAVTPRTLGLVWGPSLE